MINKLTEKIKKTNAPIVVGLDPMLSYIPKHIQEKAFAEFGETPKGAAEAIWPFAYGRTVRSLPPAARHDPASRWGHRW